MEPNFLLINKPEGWTSFDAVNFIRKKIYEERKKSGLPKTACKAKVGHAGTLDPFATGLLIIGVGREATKKLDEFKNLTKTYIATLKLGYVSDTFDKTGIIKKYRKANFLSSLPFLKGGQPALPAGREGFLTKILPNPPLTKEGTERVLKKFLGKQKQLPPMFSAKKIKGKRLYELARKGINIKRKKSKIEIYNIKLLDYQIPSPTRGGLGWGLGEDKAWIKIEVECSSGTYIRTLANDIGKKLGTGAYCEELVRTKIGNYNLEQAEQLK